MCDGRALETTDWLAVPLPGHELPQFLDLSWVAAIYTARLAPHIGNVTTAQPNSYPFQSVFSSRIFFFSCQKSSAA